jgi:uncharacterized protein
MAISAQPTAVRAPSPAGAPAGDGELTVVRGIPDGWDAALAGTPVTLRRRWIELAEGRIPGGYHTFLMTGDGGGVRVAIGGGIIESPTGHPRFDPHEVLSGRSAHLDVAKAGPHPWRGLPAGQLFPCCLLMFPNYETAAAGSGRHDPAALHRYLRQLMDWCGDRGVRSIAALFLHHHPRMADALREVGFEIVPMVERAELAVSWPDFDGYLARLSRKRRAVVRGELRKLAARGIELTERPLRADEPELVRLRGNLIEKYGGHPDPDREGKTLETLRTAFGSGDVTVFEARLADKLLTFGLFIRDDSHWTGLMTGSDYADPDSSLTYFATFFYRPAAVAAELGIEQISYGIGSLQAKCLRGCTLRPLYAACRTLGE